MADQGYLMVWGIANLKALNDSFCFTPHALIDVVHMVAFLCIYLTRSLLLLYCASYIPNIKVASFNFRYWSGKFYLVLLVTSIILSCPRFVYFHFHFLYSLSTRYHALLSGTR